MEPGRRQGGARLLSEPCRGGARVAPGYSQGGPKTMLRGRHGGARVAPGRYHWRPQSRQPSDACNDACESAMRVKAQCVYASVMLAARAELLVEQRLWSTVEDYYKRG